MQVAAMNPQYISQSDISADEKSKLEDIVKESALNDPFSLPKPILMELIEEAKENHWSDDDKQIYEEKKAVSLHLNNLVHLLARF